MHDDINIGSIRTFLNILDEIDFSNEYVYFYRGHSNHIFKLEPSIYRNHGLINNENKIFREIILRCPDDFQDSTVTFQKLVKMQHYSLPTRLLDITENSLTALFFACQDTETDGEVLIFKIPKKDIKYFDSDTVSILSNLSKLNVSFTIKKDKLKPINEFNKSEDIKLLLHEIHQEKHFFSPVINPKHIESVLCVKPKLDNQRIIRQEGAFFLFGINNEKKNGAEFPVEKIFYPNNHRLIITASKKENLLNQLKRLGINNSSIFPEIDNISKDIKETFEELNNTSVKNRLSITNKHERAKRDKIIKAFRKTQNDESKIAGELAIKKIEKEFDVSIDTDIKNNKINYHFDGFIYSDNSIIALEISYMRKINTWNFSRWNRLINSFTEVYNNHSFNEEAILRIMFIVVTDEDTKFIYDYISNKLSTLDFNIEIKIYDFDDLANELL